MKKITMILLMCFTAIVNAEETGDDWRTNASNKQKLQNLIAVMPGASVIMLQMGERYKNLYWAAKQNKWEFAQYQVEEMEDLINSLIITRPARAATAKDFKTAVFEILPKAIESQNWQNFEKTFETLRGQCMACHAKNDHAFITLPIPKSANSPVLNMR